MKKNKKNKSVSIADIVQTVASFAFAILTYAGLYLRHSAEGSFIYTLLYLTIIAITIFALVKVKKVENNFTKYRIIEAILLVAFVVEACLISKPMVNALSVKSERERLTEIGKKDIENIRELFKIYEEKEADNINVIKQSYNSTIGSRLDTDSKQVVASTKSSMSIDAYCDVLLSKKYLGDGGEGDLNYLILKTEINDYLHTATTDFDNWNLNRIFSIAKELEGKNNNVANRLTKISKQRHPDHPETPYKYVFKRINNSTYSIDQERTPQLEIDYTVQKKEMKFRNAIMNAHAPSATIISIIIFLMLLSGYLVTNRSTTVEIKKNKSSNVDDGGIDIC